MLHPACRRQRGTVGTGCLLETTRGQGPVAAIRRCGGIGNRASGVPTQYDRAKRKAQPRRHKGTMEKSDQEIR